MPLHQRDEIELRRDSWCLATSRAHQTRLTPVARLMAAGAAAQLAELASSITSSDEPFFTHR